MNQTSDSVLNKLESISDLLTRQRADFSEKWQLQEKRMRDLEARIAAAEKLIGIEAGIQSLADSLEPNKL